MVDLCKMRVSNEAFQSHNPGPQISYDTVISRVVFGIPSFAQTFTRISPLFCFKILNPKPQMREIILDPEKPVGDLLKL